MRILIVEDEIHLVSALCEILKKNKYLTDAVYDGSSGLSYALSKVYDVIILDIMLPKMNGLEVLKTLRQKKISTPVLLLTAKDEISDIVTGLDSGADDYLTKPFSTDELLARIRAMGRRKGEVIDNILKFNYTSLNLKTFELASDAEFVKLGLKEFQIAEILFYNPNQVITKEHIIEKVWGFDKDAEYNNVEVYISFIRKKLSFIKSKCEIKTIRGLGYSLEEKND